MPVSNTPATASVSTHLLSWDREVHNILGLYFEFLCSNYLGLRFSNLCVCLYLVIFSLSGTVVVH